MDKRVGKTQKCQKAAKHRSNIKYASRTGAYVGRSTMLREPQKMFALLGGSATSVVRCGLVSVTTPLILMTLDIATKAYMNCEE